jgi:hypothetical protein
MGMEIMPPESKMAGSIIFSSGEKVKITHKGIVLAEKILQTGKP